MPQRDPCCPLLSRVPGPGPGAAVMTASCSFEARRGTRDRTGRRRSTRPRAVVPLARAVANPSPGRALLSRPPRSRSSAATNGGSPRWARFTRLRTGRRCRARRVRVQAGKRTRLAMGGRDPLAFGPGHLATSGRAGGQFVGKRTLFRFLGRRVESPGATRAVLPVRTH